MLLSEARVRQWKNLFTPFTITPAEEPSTVSLPVLNSGGAEPMVMVAGLPGGKTLV
jgi:hypothetical protein